jgi:hypothetical protein
MIESGLIAAAKCLIQTSPTFAAILGFFISLAQNIWSDIGFLIDLVKDIGGFVSGIIDAITLIATGGLNAFLGMMEGIKQSFEATINSLNPFSHDDPLEHDNYHIVQDYGVGGMAMGFIAFMVLSMAIGGSVIFKTIGDIMKSVKTTTIGFRLADQVQLIGDAMRYTVNAAKNTVNNKIISRLKEGKNWIRGVSEAGETAESTMLKIDKTAGRFKEGITRKAISQTDFIGDDIAKAELRSEATGGASRLTKETGSEAENTISQMRTELGDDATTQAMRGADNNLVKGSEKGLANPNDIKQLGRDIKKGRDNFGINVVDETNARTTNSWSSSAKQKLAGKIANDGVDETVERAGRLKNVKNIDKKIEIMDDVGTKYELEVGDDLTTAGQTIEFDKSMPISGKTGSKIDIWDRTGDRLIECKYKKGIVHDGEQLKSSLQRGTAQYRSLGRTTGIGTSREIWIDCRNGFTLTDDQIDNFIGKWWKKTPGSGSEYIDRILIKTPSGDIVYYNGIRWP